jgi:predicted enzyme related to lactoylglutathione lyase
MRLAKPALDVGYFTNQREAMLEFWQQVIGATFDELLPLGVGVQQHRHRLGHSILKINHSRDPLPDLGSSGYRELWIARSDVRSPRSLLDPDGNCVTLIPPGHDGIEQIEVRLAVRDPAAHMRFYELALGLPRVSSGCVSCGTSRIAFHLGTDVVADPEMRARGFRYTTVQVYDVVGEHRGIIERGGREGLAPVRVGDVAYISMVLDPDGNWIEISQRKSLTGSLD